jgi:hypothetical protein
MTSQSRLTALALALVSSAWSCRDRATRTPPAPPHTSWLDASPSADGRFDDAMSALAHDATAALARDAHRDASASDAAGVTARCPMRSFPPDELSIGAPPDASASIVWNGREWGVAWSESVTDEPTVFFARVGRDGHRIGNPTRISDRGFRGTSPSLLWNGRGWAIAYSGGGGRFEEIWFAIVDERGTPIGRSRRLTARNRRDFAPALATNGRDTLVVWSAQLPENRWGILAVKVNRWGSQLDYPILVADRRERLGAPNVIWNGFAWAAAWLVSRTEAIAVDMARIEPDVSRVRGYPARVTIGPLGGTDQGARLGFAWDGVQYGLVWDEVRDGAPHAFFDTVGRLLEPRSRGVMLSPRVDSATAPAIISLAPSVFLAAWVVERGHERHVQVQTFDGDARPFGEHIEVQSNDGIATMPAIAASDDAVGIATVSARGVSFHRVPLGPCPQ